MIRIKKISILVLLVLAGGVLLSAFHYHEGGIIFDDCPACRYQDSGVTTVSVDSETPVSPLPLPERDLIVEFEISYTSFSRPFQTLPNAPPDTRLS